MYPILESIVTRDEIASEGGIALDDGQPKIQTYFNLVSIYSNPATTYTLDGAAKVNEFLGERLTSHVIFYQGPEKSGFVSFYAKEAGEDKATIKLIVEESALDLCFETFGSRKTARAVASMPELEQSIYYRNIHEMHEAQICYRRHALLPINAPESVTVATKKTESVNDKAARTKSFEDMSSDELTEQIKNASALIARAQLHLPKAFEKEAKAKKVKQTANQKSEYHLRTASEAARFFTAKAYELYRFSFKTCMAMPAPCAVLDARTHDSHVPVFTVKLSPQATQHMIECMARPQSYLAELCGGNETSSTHLEVAIKEITPHIKRIRGHLQWLTSKNWEDLSAKPGIYWLRCFQYTV